jgi:plasmid replication initiation protein
MAKSLKKKINVKQSNELTEAAYHLSLKGKRVLWLCLMHTYFTQDEDSTTPVFTVAVSDYEEIFNVSRNQASRDVRQAIDELSCSRILFYPKSGPHDIVSRPWLAEAGARTSKGLWEIEFNYKVLPYLYVLGNQFTTFSLRDCGSLKNPRTVRLYESLCQFKSSGIWVTSHDWISERFMLPESQRQNVAELKRTFLEPALRQINDRTPLAVTYQAESSGKLVFSIHSKSGL